VALLDAISDVLFIVFAFGVKELNIGTAFCTCLCLCSAAAALMSTGL
jgi:hypothetical protein